MKVKQFRYSKDNLGYLVYGPKTAIAIDDSTDIKIEGLRIDGNYPNQIDNPSWLLIYNSDNIYLDNNIVRNMWIYCL